MDSTNAKFKFLAECAGWASGVALLIAFAITPVPDPHSESRFRFYFAHLIFAGVVFCVIFIIGIVFIIIKKLVLHIISWFQ